MAEKKKSVKVSEEKHAENEKRKDEKEILQKPAELPGQPCPVCGTNNLTLREEDMEIPYFGPVSIFSMSCSNCDFRKSDVECLEAREPCRYTFEVFSEEDMKVRVVKSSAATVKITYIGSMEPGEFSEGFVTNIEGLLMKFKDIVQFIRENEEEDEENRDKAKNIMKKIDRVICGREKIKIIIEDPAGNSAIISDRAVVEKLKPVKN